MKFSSSFPSFTRAWIFFAAASIASTCSGCLTRCLSASRVTESKIPSGFLSVIYPFYRSASRSLLNLSGNTQWCVAGHSWADALSDNSSAPSSLRGGEACLKFHYCLSDQRNWLRKGRLPKLREILWWNIYAKIVRKLGRFTVFKLLIINSLT